MPYCAVYGCKSDSKREKGISFFKFPTEDDRGRLKAWIHYCRRKEFTPSQHSRICHKHFSAAQYERDPTFLAQFGYSGAKPALLTMAVPDVPMHAGDENAPPPLCTPSPPQRPELRIPRSAFAKRRRLEVLQDAVLENEADTEGQSSPDFQSPEVQRDSQTTDKDIQVSITMQPVTRTRRIQVGRPQLQKETAEVGVQCEMKCSCSNQQQLQEDSLNSTLDLPTSPPSSLDTSFLSSHIDEEMDSDSEYNPDETLTDSDLDDMEDEVEEEETYNYRLEKVENPADEKFYVVSESALYEAFSRCRSCGGNATPLIRYSKGTMISVISTCENGHIQQWESQRMLNQLPEFNLVLASAILISGSNTSKTLRLMNHSRIKTTSTRTIQRLQSMYTVPAVIEEFQSQQADILQSLREKPHVVLGGDGRCDSPGYSAKYCSYSMMDLDTNKIVDLQIIQSNEVKGSTHMELEGLKRCLSNLEEAGGITVQDVITDRHVMVKSFMRQEKPDIRHYFDVWHIAKGLSKKLEAASKRRGGEEIRTWNKSIVNHCYYVAARCGDDDMLKVALWKSVANHVADIHDHDSEILPHCEHGDLEDRAWLMKGSRCHKLVQEIVLSPYLLRDIPKLSPVHQTYGLEVFHSVVNQFAPKNTHFFYSAMRARLYVAAIHFNENGNRQQAVTKDGRLQWKKCYPKAKKGTEYVAKPQKVAPTFGYVDLLMDRILRRREDIPSLPLARHNTAAGHRAEEPQPLTTAFSAFDLEHLVETRCSRFHRQTNLMQAKDTRQIE